MHAAVDEIFRLVADRIVSPEEGQNLLSALRDGYPEAFDLSRPEHQDSEQRSTQETTGRADTDVAPGDRASTRDHARRQTAKPTGSSGAARAPGSSAGSRYKTRGKLGPGTGSSESEGPTDDPGPWPGHSAHPPPKELPSRETRRRTRSGTQPPAPAPPDTPPERAFPPREVDDVNGPKTRESGEEAIRLSARILPLGETVEIPAGVMLRIEMAPGGADAVDPLTSVAVRGVPGANLRVIRGEGVELHRDSPLFWRLTWPNGMLFLEIPAMQAGLEILDIPGSVGLSGYTGPFSCEKIWGGLTVHGPASPFRVREVQGNVRLIRLALQDGISTVSSVHQDVEIETAAGASVTIRAPAGPGLLDGAAGLEPEVDDDNDSLERRHGVWRVGTGTAQLNIGQVRGQLRLRTADGTGAELP